MTKYISYEEGYKGTYTLEEMKTLYATEVNKEEYTTFEDWFFDMIRSGVFEEEIIMFTTEEINKAKELAYKNWKNEENTEIGFEHYGVWITNPFFETSGRLQFVNYDAMCEYYGVENIETFIYQILENQ